MSAAPTRAFSNHLRSRTYADVVVLTVGLLYLTLLLGVSTRATASGLACNANWPLCDGGLLNLFPATLPSAFEWIHRVVAMIAGLAILTSGILAWRDGAGRRVLGAIALATVLLPLQVWLGRETVLTFTPPVLAAHYWVAMTIFASFVLAATWARLDRFGSTHVRRAVLGAAALVPIAIVLGPPLIASYSAPVQAIQYAAFLAAFGALLFATAVSWHRRQDLLWYRVLATVATVLVPLVVALMRQRIVHPDSLIAAAHPFGVAVSIGAVWGLGLASWRIERIRGGGDRTPLRRP